MQTGYRKLENELEELVDDENLSLAQIEGLENEVAAANPDESAENLPPHISPQAFASAKDRGRARKALIAGSLGTFLPGLLIFSLPALFTPYWANALPASEAQLGWVVTLVVLSSGIFTYLSGLLRMRIGTRNMYIGSLVLMLVAMVLPLLFPTSLVAVYFWAFIAGTSTTFAYSPSLSAVQEWFPHRLGLVTGIINISFAMFAAVAAPFVAQFLNAYGFPVTMWGLIATITVVTLIVIALATPHEVEQARVAFLQQTREKSGGKIAESKTAGQAVRTAAFWQVWIIWFATGVAAITMLTFAPLYSERLTEIGVAVSSVAVVTAFAVGNGVARVIISALIDRISPVYFGFVSYFGLGFGWLLLVFVDNGTVLTVVSFLAGMGLGTMFTTAPKMLTPVFGLKFFGVIFGLIFAAYGIFGALAGPLFATNLSVAFDYKPVFVYLSAMGFLAFATVIAHARTRKKILGAI